MISRNICEVGDLGDSVYYEAHCSCGSEPHQQQLCIEADKEYPGQLSLMIYSKIYTESPDTSNNYDADFQTKIENWVKRIKKTWAIIVHVIVHGYVEGSNEFLFSDEKAILDYAKAIIEGVAKVKQNRRLATKTLD